MMFIFFGGGLKNLKLVLFLVFLVLSVCLTLYNVRISDRVQSRPGQWPRTQTKEDRNGMYKVKIKMVNTVRKSVSYCLLILHSNCNLFGEFRYA